MSPGIMRCRVHGITEERLIEPRGESLKFLSSRKGGGVWFAGGIEEMFGSSL